MIPTVFRARTGGEAEARRLWGAVIGIAGAVGALGGVLVNLAFRESFLQTGSGQGAYAAFLAFYALCVVVTGAVYLRRSDRALVGV